MRREWAMLGDIIGDLTRGIQKGGIGTPRPEAVTKPHAKQTGSDLTMPAEDRRQIGRTSLPLRDNQL